jgi:hypothetical protein
LNYNTLKKGFKTITEGGCLMKHLMKNLRNLSFAIVCLLITATSISYAAQSIPALQNAKDAADRARIQTLIDGARAEGELLWMGFFLEPEHGKYILDGFKAYYGLSDLNAQYTYEPHRAHLRLPGRSR